jgi:putative ATP-binding cassette transporter
MVSIAHRPTVAAFHDKQWTLVPQADGSTALYALKESHLPHAS